MIMFKCTRGDRSACRVFRHTLFGVVWLWAHRMPIGACPLTRSFTILYLFLPSSQLSPDGGLCPARSVMLVFLLSFSQPSPDGEPLLACSVVLVFFSFFQLLPDGEPLLACSVVLDFFSSLSQPSPDGERLLARLAVLDFFFCSPSHHQMVGFVLHTQPCQILCPLSIRSFVH